METDIRHIFEINKELIASVDRAICMFRIGRYDKALEWAADTADELNAVADSIMKEREYFESVSTDFVSEMLKSIVDATVNKDYCLLADIYEMQLVSLLCAVQELILGKEQFLAFDNDEYHENIASLKSVLREMIEERSDLTPDEQKRFRVNLNAKLDDMFDPSEFLKKGFNLEFTSGGFMTISAPMRDKSIYLHSNGRVINEAIQLALNWYDPVVDEYIVYGFGMGYHIEELHRLAPDKRIVVYESDLDILKLYCAFRGHAYLLSEENIFVVYDRDMSVLAGRLDGIVHQNEDGKYLFAEEDGRIARLCVHYPSYRRSAGCAEIDAAVPWKKIVEGL